MKMKYAIIFHGTGGHPEENWFPWLKNELRKYDYEVIIPQFPTLPKFEISESHTPEKWFEVFEKYKKYLDSDTILIGHSLGGGFLLRVLEKINVKVKAAIFVAPSVGVKPIKYWEGDKLFVEKPFDWNRIRESAQKFIVFHSEDDPFICIRNSEKLAKAGHFNKAAGYEKFDLLLEKIKIIL